MVTRTPVRERVEACLSALVSAIPDPEIPVVSIADLGILRDLHLEGSTVVVTITPTYSGCPAMDAIRADIAHTCRAAGYPDVEVGTALSPAWTTDWITDEGRRKLREYGIAPPDPAGGGRTEGPVFLGLIELRDGVPCPQCGSHDTREVSRFGSTACKSLWACNACLEPFDHFKPL
jgi:ring-1,2-phenylacetyl-CoA epoxidase subunit PaaD